MLRAASVLDASARASARAPVLLRRASAGALARGALPPRPASPLASLATAARRWSSSVGSPSSSEDELGALAPAAEPAVAIIGADEGAFLMSESPSHARFVNMLMLDGKKQTARSIMRGTFDKLREGGHDPQTVFISALDNARPALEMRTMSKLQVPYPLGPRRAEGQAMKWLIKAARDRKSDGSMAMKLAQEFLQASELKGSAVQKREAVHALAMANQATAHFRWRQQSDKAVGAVNMDRKSFRPQGVRAVRRYQGPIRSD